MLYHLSHLGPYPVQRNRYSIARPLSFLTVRLLSKRFTSKDLLASVSPSTNTTGGMWGRGRLKGSSAGEGAGSSWATEKTRCTLQSRGTSSLYASRPTFSSTRKGPTYCWVSFLVTPAEDGMEYPLCSFSIAQSPTLIKRGWCFRL